MFKSIDIWASISIVHRSLGDLIDSAALILMIIFIVNTICILTPGTDTVHWLRTAIVGTLLKLIGVCASISILCNCYLVEKFKLGTFFVYKVQNGHYLGFLA